MVICLINNILCDYFFCLPNRHLTEIMYKQEMPIPKTPSGIKEK